MKCLLVFVVALAVAADAAVPPYPGYINPSLYSTGAVPAFTNIDKIETVVDLTSKYIIKLKGYISDAPSLARIDNVETVLDLTSKYLNQLKALIPATPALARIDNVQAVLDLTFNYLGQLKANIPDDAFSFTIPTTTGALTSTYQNNIPDSSQIDNVKAVLDLTSEYISQLKGYNVLPGDIPTSAVPLTYQSQLIDTSCKNNLGLSVPCALRRKRSPQAALAAAFTSIYTGIVPALAKIENMETVVDLTSKYIIKLKGYISDAPSLARIENIETVLDLTSKYLSQLKTLIPAAPAMARIDNVQAVLDLTFNYLGQLKANIPAEAISFPIPTTTGSLTSTYQYNIQGLSKIENVKAVLDLTSEYLSQLKGYDVLPGDIPSAAVPSHYLGQRVYPVAIPTATGPLIYTYQGNIPASAKIEDVKAVLDLTSGYLSKLKAYTPADALPVAAQPVVIPSVPILGAAISGF